MAYFVIEVVLAALLYCAAAFALWRHHGAGAPHRNVVLLAGLGLALHFISLLHLMLYGPGMVIGIGTALSLFAWQTALLLWLFSLRRSTGALGLAIYPLTALCAIAGFWIPDQHGVHEALDWQVQTHIALSMIAYGLLTLGAVQAIVLAIQHHELHRHPPRNLLATLPPLQTMETLLFRLIGAGFFVLTLAIATGALFINHLLEQHLAHKLVLSVLAWLIYIMLLVGRWQRGWRGRVAIRWTIIAYLVLVLAYFGSKLVLELILGEHWW